MVDSLHKAKFGIELPAFLNYIEIFGAFPYNLHDCALLRNSGQNGTQEA